MAQRTPPPPPPATREREASTAEHDPGVTPGEEKRAPVEHAAPSPGSRAGWSAAIAFVAGALIGGVLAGTLLSGDGGDRPAAGVEELREQNARLRSEVADATAQSASLEGEVFELRQRVSELRADTRAPGNTRGEPADITVDYGGWNDLFDISQLELRRANAGWRLRGEIEYLGGGACPLGYIEVTASIWRGGTVIATDTSAFESLAEGRRQPLRFVAPGEARPDRADVTLSNAFCAA